MNILFNKSIYFTKIVQKFGIHKSILNFHLFLFKNAHILFFWSINEPLWHTADAKNGNALTPEGVKALCIVIHRRKYVPKAIYQSYFLAGLEPTKA